jgi:hypothetical protein
MPVGEAVNVFGKMIDRKRNGFFGEFDGGGSSLCKQEK